MQFVETRPWRASTQNLEKAGISGRQFPVNDRSSRDPRVVCAIDLINMDSNGRHDFRRIALSRGLVVF